MPTCPPTCMHTPWSACTHINVAGWNRTLLKDLPGSALTRGIHTTTNTNRGGPSSRDRFHCAEWLVPECMCVHFDGCFCEKKTCFLQYIRVQCVRCTTTVFMYSRITHALDPRPCTRFSLCCIRPHSAHWHGDRLCFHICCVVTGTFFLSEKRVTCPKLQYTVRTRITLVVVSDFLLKDSIYLNIEFSTYRGYMCIEWSSPGIPVFYADKSFVESKQYLKVIPVVLFYIRSIHQPQVPQKLRPHEYLVDLNKLKLTLLIHTRYIIRRIREKIYLIIFS